MRARLSSQVGEPDEQMSLFAALSAVVTDGDHPAQSVFDDDYEDDVDAGLDEQGDAIIPPQIDADAYTIDLIDLTSGLQGTLFGGGPTGDSTANSTAPQA